MVAHAKVHHLGFYFISCDITLQDLLSVVDDKEVGQKCSNDRFIIGFEVGSISKEFLCKIDSNSGWSYLRR